MSQDSEQNDRKAGPSRDGDPQRQDGRSFGRRDDVRSNGPTGPRSTNNRDADRPRFSRDNDRPKFNRPADGDRPRFNRDDRLGGPRDGDSRNSGGPNRPFRPAGPRSEGTSGKPRFDRDNNDRPKFNRPADGDRPRFSRDNDRPKFDRPADGDRPRFSRDNDRPKFGRPADGDRPRSNRDNNDRPKFNRPADTDRPRFNREDRTYRPAGAGPRNNTPRTDEPTGNPRLSRDDRPDSRNRDTDTPRFAKDQGRGASRFDSDRPKREVNREGDRPRINRGDFPRDNDRRNDAGRTGTPRFSRDGGAGRPEKPAFKRVGGFSREADERNRFGSDDQPSERRNDQEEDTRFSGKQRKESGDRRTGSFTKAPNYNLEQTRAADTFKRGRGDDKRRDQSGEGGSDKPKRQPSNDGTTRLNRYIANSGVCSRREADELIARGDISVNGKVVTEMGYKVKEGDTVRYGTKSLTPERFVYVLLNKPKDYITTTEDPEERKTVMELVADAGNFRMYPVGRLDRNTTGLLLVTNDGELADKLTHPSNNVRKIYQVELDKPIMEEHLEAIKKGIELEDGPIKPDAVSIVTPDAYVVGIEIHSGRNRIVRRIFESFGYEVTKLDRTTYAGLTKKELPRGKWRFLDPKEVVKLKYLNS
jgi:23S rRNA pseudouridine2605 synthase